MCRPRPRHSPSSAGTAQAPPRAACPGSLRGGQHCQNRLETNAPTPLTQRCPATAPPSASLSQGTRPGAAAPHPALVPALENRPGRDSALRPRSARPRVPPAAASPRPSRRSAPRPPRGSAARHPGRHRAQSVAQGAAAAPGSFRVRAAAIRCPPPPARHGPAPGRAQGCELQLPAAPALLTAAASGRRRDGAVLKGAGRRARTSERHVQVRGYRDAGNTGTRGTPGCGDARGHGHTGTAAALRGSRVAPGLRGSPGGRRARLPRLPGGG